VEWISGGITAVSGVLAAGINCGIKGSKPDLALIVLPRPVPAAAVFTRNRIQAAPVQLCRQRLRQGLLQAVVVNSGNANACTGRQGLADAAGTAEAAAQVLGIKTEYVWVASTGVIGVPLPMEKIRAGIPRLAAALSPEGGRAAATAIMTTDTFPKEAAVRLEVGGRQVTIGGMAKGAGMIRPQLATMLAFLATDAPLGRERLQVLLSRAVEDSFNMVIVDGDTSTNDMVVLAATGGEAAWGAAEEAVFAEGLLAVCRQLARLIAKDGEGASRLLEVRVSGARNKPEARRVALAVAGSNLVKAALYGGQLNWGRIAAAVGYSGAEVMLERLEVRIGEVVLVRDGYVVAEAAEAAAENWARPEVVVRINLGLGDGEALAWGCDLSPEYVKINADYS